MVSADSCVEGSSVIALIYGTNAVLLVIVCEDRMKDEEVVEHKRPLVERNSTSAFFNVKLGLPVKRF